MRKVGFLRSARVYLFAGLGAIVLAAALSSWLLPTPASPGELDPSPSTDRLAAAGKAAAAATATPMRTRLAPASDLRPEATASPTPAPSVLPTAEAGAALAVATPSAPRPSATGRPKITLPYFGVEMERIDAEHGLAQVLEAGLGVTRVAAVRWNLVEPVKTDPPTYRWETMRDVEQELLNSAQAGLQVTLLVLFTPQWAQAVPGHSCSAISENRLGDFAQFLQAAVARYSVPPYNVKYWELFNEPDVDPSLVGPDSGFGCWGDQNVDGYGGAAYASMLKSAYPAIKAADPDSQVIFGGLLLESPDRPAAEFLAGALQAGAGKYFDILAYHAYSYYEPGVYEWDKLPKVPWNSWGSIVAGKAQFLRREMAKFGYDKPLVLNEAAFGWGGSGDPPQEFYTAQADFVPKLFARGRALDLGSVGWYGWQGVGWRRTTLVNSDRSPKPGYHALVFAVQQLKSAQFLARTNYPGIEGYAFRRGEDRLEIVWSADGQPHPVRIPASRFRGAFDSIGQPVSSTELSGTVELSVLTPAYIQLTP